MTTAPDFPKAVSADPVYDQSPTGLGLSPLAALLDPLIQAPGVTPSGTASGDLTGSYPNPSIAAGAVTDTKTAVANKDGLAGTPSMRTLGTGALQACAGNDSRLSDSRAPSGTAGGDLTGTFPNPTIAAGKVTSDKASLSHASADGDAVTITTAGTYYDGASVSLAAGTWVVWAHANVKVATAAGDAHAKIWDGTTVADTDQATSDTADDLVSLSMFAVVSPGSTVSYKVSCTADQDASEIVHSRIVAVRIA